MTPELRIACPDDQKFQVVEQVIKHFEADYSLKTLDGMFLEFNEHTWAVCRCSNTAPQLTLRFESQTREDLFAVIDLLAAKLDEYDFLDAQALYGTKKDI